MDNAARSRPAPERGPKPKRGDGKIIGFFGMQGTGKTYRALCFAKTYGKTLYLDSENKAHEVLEEKFPELSYNKYVPNISDESEWNDDADVDIYVWSLFNQSTFMPDDLASVNYFISQTPRWIDGIRSGKYSVVVIDNCSPFKQYARAKWLSMNPNRDRPLRFEYGEIERIIQQALLPFINACKIFGAYMIMCYHITPHYVNDVEIGTREDAKQWLLGLLSYEMWFERDYKVYCLKHPYKPFWEYRDENENICDYLFDREFIENEVTFKEYVRFKEETLISESRRMELEEEKKKRGLSLG